MQKRAQTPELAVLLPSELAKRQCRDNNIVSCLFAKITRLETQHFARYPRKDLLVGVGGLIDQDCTVSLAFAC